MAKKKKKEILPGMELIIIVVFFLSFILWAMSQCNSTKLKYQKANADPVTEDTIAKPQPEIIQTSSVAKIADSLKILPELPQNSQKKEPAPIVKTIIQKQTSLYVSTDSLKLRAGPGLEYDVVFKIPLHTELIFMQEVSDSTQILNVGGQIVNKPWVKVQHPKGHIGWVYGAYVDFYKKTVLSE